MASTPRMGIKLPKGISFSRIPTPWGLVATEPGEAGDRISWQAVSMEEGIFNYAVAGEGLPVLFLHGWGVSHKTYKGAIASLASLGCKVVAPALPGFGGAPKLTSQERSFRLYAEWAMRFLEAVGIGDSPVVIGHSFGGGIAIQVAHDYSSSVRSAILCNPVGGPVRCGPNGEIESMSNRPIWEWGQELGVDLLSGSSPAKVIPAVAEGAVPNLFKNLPEVLKVVNIVRHADLLEEVERASNSGVPISIIWSDRDRLVPHGAVTGLCRAAGVRSVVVEGSHTWLISEPEMFADVVLRTMVDLGIDLDLFSGSISDII
jgi:pimeloyl-ACP methyl ester carboxylesterase